MYLGQESKKDILEQNMQDIWSVQKFLAFKVCFYDTLVPTREYKSGYAADRFARKCAAQGLWCSLHGLAVSDGSCEWVEISAC